MRKLAVTILLLVGIATGVAGAQEIRRPTAEADNSGAGCTATNTDVSATMPNFYDAGGDSTSSVDNLITPNVGTASFKQGRTFSSIPAASGPYSVLNLKVNSKCVQTQGSGSCTLGYSLDSGGTWTNLHSATTWAQTTDTVSLSTSQDLTQVQVRYCMRAVDNTSTGSETDLTGYDIRTEGTLSSGTAKRRITTN